MSVAVMARIWADPPVGGSQLLVLLALADNADDDRRYAWPSVATLARKTRMSERSVQRALRELEGGGLISIVRPGGQHEGGNRSTIYCVNPDQGRQIVTGDSGVTGGVSPVSPEPSGEPSSLSGDAREKLKPVSYRGRKVQRETVDSAARVLDVFSEAAGRKHSARTGKGEATPALKQVIGAMLARPEVTEEEWAAAVRNTVANPPRFVDGPLVLGHVFGERAAEHALANTGKSGGPSGASVQSVGVQTPPEDDLDQLVRW